MIESVLFWPPVGFSPVCSFPAQFLLKGETTVAKKLQAIPQFLLQQRAEMEAIKKKMQAMKVEKDNACDRVDVCEEQCKAARVSFFSSI